MASVETELEMAERHVRQGERHVGIQHDVLEHLSRVGELPDPTFDVALRVLRQFEDLLEMRRQHLQRLRHPN